MQKYLILLLMLTSITISACQNNNYTGSAVFKADCEIGTRDQRATCYSQKAVSLNDFSQCQDILTKVSGAYLSEAIDCITLIADHNTNPIICDQITTLKNTVPNTWEPAVWNEKMNDCVSISSA